MTKKNKICEHCGKLIWDTSKYCRKYAELLRRTKKPKYCKNCGAEIKNHYAKFCRKCFQLDEKNPTWKGNKVGYTALHNWIKRHKNRLTYCETCGKKTKRLDLANISQEYKRDINDWEWLCRRCHMIKDGRMEKLIKRMKNKRIWYKRK